MSGLHLRVVHAASLHAHDAVAESQWNWEVAGSTATGGNGVRPDERRPWD